MRTYDPINYNSQGVTYDRKRFEILGDRDINSYYKWIHSQEWSDRIRLAAALEPMSHFDLYQYKDGKELQFVELKGRSVEINAFPDANIDITKMSQLQNLARTTNKKVFLVLLYYKSKQLAIWKINPNRNYETIVKNVNEVTVYSRANENKIQKTMVKLPFGEASIYPFEPVEAGQDPSRSL